jgi:hypothetical protein
MATRLPDIDQVIPMGPTDDQLMADLRCVLDQHGALERFGITLLHQHFDLGDDEVLVESVDPTTRTLTIRPKTASQFEGMRSIETQWRLDDARGMLRCVQVCPGGSSSEHQGWPSHQNI